jgi:hypothetical protein
LPQWIASGKPADALIGYDALSHSGKRTHKILRPKIIRAVALAERRVFMADYTTVGGDPALVFAGIRTRLGNDGRLGACSIWMGPVSLKLPFADYMFSAPAVLVSALMCGQNQAYVMALSYFVSLGSASSTLFQQIGLTDSKLNDAFDKFSERHIEKNDFVSRRYVNHAGEGRWCRREKHGEIAVSMIFNHVDRSLYPRR